MDSKDWRDGLSEDQIRAAEHKGTHARLLAGPGTGKTRTLTHRVLALITEHHVDPSRILVLTFTRVAAFQFREGLEKILAPLGLKLPRASTLHSFALRQLLRNSDRVAALPRPLRIADDWEERYIIEEDLKKVLGKQDVREVRKLFHQLSADWETLNCEKGDWEQTFPDPKFLGGWREHREVYGYTLRAELVYQLKRALNQYPDFELESGFEHLLVDEYQDMNACDLSVIKELAGRGMELFVAGDDDQSIYGFRYADPTGIREFPRTHPRTLEFALETCFRCDRLILRFAEFVANLDPQRLPKPTKARKNADEGEVHILCYPDQYCEADGVASICQKLTNLEGVAPEEILILIRSDYQKRISSALSPALKRKGVPVVEWTEEGPLESEEGRLVLATLRLMNDRDDHLAWRTLLNLETNHIGDDTVAAIQEMAQNRALRFASALHEIRDNPTILPHFGKRVAKYTREVQERLSRLAQGESTLANLLEKVSSELIGDPVTREAVKGYLNTVRTESTSESLTDLLQALGASLGAAEQELMPGAVNILTMHKAKGLSADTVIIVGAEDEFIPGKNLGQREGDERRLLYVSMTRAKHRLFVTYCQKRTGKQRFTGRNSGNPGRTLTRFLRDAPIRVEFQG